MNVNWESEDGSIIDYEDYLRLKSRARGMGLCVREYLTSIGLRHVYRSGELQDMLNNRAEITTWSIEVDGTLLFLTKWKYKKISADLRGSGIEIRRYLEDCGYVLWKDRFSDSVTLWVDRNTGEPLFRKEYVRLSNQDRELCMKEFLISLGYVKITDKKFKENGSVTL